MSQVELGQLVSPENIPSPQTDDRGYRRLGLIVLGLLIGIFGIWGALAPLNSAVPATGKVSVASSNRIVQHLEGGIVNAILVKDGDMVQAGQPLVELDRTQINAQLEMALAQYHENLGIEARLIAERDDKNTVIFDPDLQKMPTIMTMQRNEFNVRAQQLNSQIQVLMERIAQIRNQIEGLESTVLAKTYLSHSYADEIKELEVLFAQQLIDKNRLRDIKRDKSRVDSEIANAKSEIARAKGQISETQAQIIGQKQNFKKEVAAQLSDAHAHLADLRPRVTALQNSLDRTKITAPVAGIVSNLQVHTVGGVTTPGKPILEIVPENEPLIIEAKAVATDISYLHLGLKAEIQFPGFSHIKTLKTVMGEVVQIAPDAIMDEATHMPYYPLKIRVTPEGQVELQRNRLTIQPGMPASIMIITASQTFLDYMIQPFKNMIKNSFNEQ